jgi:hypothetical protein
MLVIILGYPELVSVASAAKKKLIGAALNLEHVF